MPSLLLTLALFMLPLTGAPSDPSTGGQLPCKPLRGPETLSLDAAELRLDFLARIVSCGLERNLILEPTALGSRAVTLHAPEPIDARALLALWRLVLSRNDLEETKRGAYFVVRARAK
jgi:hypothetical protein